MSVFKLNQAEVITLQQVLETQQDISNDTVLDDVFMSRDETSFDYDKIQEIRQSTSIRIDTLTILVHTAAIISTYSEGGIVIFSDTDLALFVNEVDCYHSMITDIISETDKEKLAVEINHIVDVRCLLKLFQR